MVSTTAINVVADANIALEWSHAEGEEEVAEARAPLAAHRGRTIALTTLDLTVYELGSALLRGRSKTSAEQATTVLQARGEICPAGDPRSRAPRNGAGRAPQHRHRRAAHDPVPDG